MEAYTRIHFFEHGKLDPSSNERLSCHWCQIRSFPTHKRLPITITNDTDDGATLPPTFKFIAESVLTNGVERAGEEFRSGCECAHDEDCMYDTCLCLQDIEPDDDIETAEETGSDGKFRRKIFAYYAEGENKGLLRTRMLQGTAPIYECQSYCGCSKQCPNRVVERGRTVPLEIFRTKDGRGWGVRCADDLQAGQFVDIYLGEVLTPKEAKARRRASGKAQRKDVYLFALDKFMDDESADPRLRGDPLEVDGEFMSGPTRFINHSCDPNLRIFARVADHANKHIHDLAFFAIKDISAGTELTFDYMGGWGEGSDEDDVLDRNQISQMTICLCGSKNCRGYLW